MNIFFTSIGIRNLLLIICFCSVGPIAALSQQLGYTHENGTLGDTSTSAAVNASVNAQIQQNIGAEPAFSDGSVGSSATPMSGGSAFTSQSTAHMSAFVPPKSQSVANGAMFEKLFQPSSAVLGNTVMQDISPKLAPKRKAEFRPQSQFLSNSGAIDESGENTPNYRGNNSLPLAGKEVSHQSSILPVHSIPSVLIGEFPDSTRERVWPSLGFNYDANFLRFSPAIQVLEPNFDDAVKPHFFYNRRGNLDISALYNWEQSKQSIGSSSSLQDSLTGLQLIPNSTNGVSLGLTPELQPDNSPSLNSFQSPDNSPLTDPLDSLTGQ